MAVVARRNTNASLIAARAARKSADIAEKALTNVNRPYVYVLNVSGFHLVQPGEQTFVTFDVANYGETPADVDEIRAAITISSMEYPDGPPIVPISHPVYAPHEKIKGFRLHVDRILPFSHRRGRVVPSLLQGQRCFLRVVIYYRGPFSEGHESSFCWCWDDDSESMMRWGGREYNYVA